MLKKYSQKGFTIVELLIVIVVIGILAALVLNTFSGVQKRARDTQRQTDINAIATQLEVYYNDNGAYPLIATVDAPSLKGIDVGALTPPGYTTRQMVDENTTVDLGGRTANSKYGYKTYDADGTTECTAAGGCAKFKLHWVKEDAVDDASALQTKSSLN